MVGFLSLPSAMGAGSTVSTKSAATSSTHQDKSGKASSKAGIRFVLRNQEGAPKSELFLQIDEKKVTPISFRLGLPGTRVPFPKAPRIRIFDKEPKPEELGKMKPILDAPMPQNMSAKMIGLIGYSDKGYNIYFINEVGLRAGLVHFINLTNKPYLIDLPKPLSGEKNRFLLNPNDQYTLGKSVSAPNNESIPIRLYHQIPLNGTPKWMIERRAMVALGSTRSVIFILMPDPAGTSMITHEIMVYDESI